MSASHRSEALRILETEGLDHGAAGQRRRSHRPSAPQEAKVVYMMGLVLQSRQAPASATSSTPSPPSSRRARRRRAPRADRADTVLPVLRATFDAAQAAIDDAAAYTGLARSTSIWSPAAQNEAMRLVGRPREPLDRARRPHGPPVERHGGFDDLAARKASAREHEKLLRLHREGRRPGGRAARPSPLLQPRTGINLKLIYPSDPECGTAVNVSATWTETERTFEVATLSGAIWDLTSWRLIGTTLRPKLYWCWTHRLRCWI